LLDFHQNPCKHGIAPLDQHTSSHYSGDTKIEVEIGEVNPLWDH